MREDTIMAILIFVICPLTICLMVYLGIGCEQSRAKFRTECFEKVKKEECWKL